ncbi:MAG: hypothetical protein JST70_01760 [Bacteroidetes bacterium]|nr:hypothetical protein [Bacteroidota bacterium]
MNKTVSVIFVLIYLLSFLAAETVFGYNLLYGSIFPNSDYDLLFRCIAVGGIGGILYCLRGTYLNFCVTKSWDNDWIVWYIVRPIASLISGGVSCLFLKAGLLVLEAEKETDASNLGFYALAFIAGLNVDKFIAKIEELAKATWGIDKSRSADKN